MHSVWIIICGFLLQETMEEIVRVKHIVNRALLSLHICRITWKWNYTYTVLLMWVTHCNISTLKLKLSLERTVFLCRVYSGERSLLEKAISEFIVK